MTLHKLPPFFGQNIISDVLINGLLICQLQVAALRQYREHTSLVLLVPVYVVLELNADLSLGGLVADERVLQELLRVGPLGVVLQQARLHEVVEP